ncbi:Rdx family-domain-containing protein [Lipomyces japonicus]|uniref:Rdx family-domain-containing protein n=1 Tax=Lipomyces japonicus TaxID=56871 RepID=UPI0034CE2727
MAPTYPRVAIEFCTGCKWNLRAAWYAQELLSTFGNDVGEVALVPASGGTFIVRLTATAHSGEVVIWDRKVNDGFPDSKDLKRLFRDYVTPGKDLGHVDRHAGNRSAAKSENKSTPASTSTSTSTTSASAIATGEYCEDCQPSTS